MPSSTASASTILLVDDEQNILTSLAGVFEDEGHRVLQAKSGEEALALLERETPDAAVLDIWMPGLDGIEALRKIKTSHPDIEVIMVTGHGTIETAVQATKLGAFDFLEKPLSLPAVLNAVERALDHRRLLLENRQLRLMQMRPHKLLGDSAAARALRSAIERLAGSDADVVIEGEQGVGKKLAARLVHVASRRRDGRFVDVSAEGQDETALAALLLGGAGHAREGALARASAGTLYVGGQLPDSVRARLLAAADGFGGVRPRLMLGIVLPATAPELPAAESLVLPPLRERREDIPELARSFLYEYTNEHGRAEKALAADAEKALCDYRWPSNVEELKNVMERLALTSQSATITLSDLPVAVLGGASAPDLGDISFDEAELLWERQFLAAALKRHGGEVDAVARSLRMPAEMLARKLQAVGLMKPAKAAAGQPQRTLARSVVLGGQGLHSGTKTGLILNPLPPNSGILFGSISHPDTVPALVDYVERTGYATSLRHGRAVAKTIEHLMAALHAYGVTNLLVKISEEVPIMDGSSLDFCQLLEDGGVVDQDATVAEIVVDRTLQVGDPDDADGEWIAIEPAPHFEVSYDLHYPPPVGHQHFDFVLEDADAFKRLIAPARTFGFLRDLEKLEEMGLGTGGRLSNFILIDDEKVVNTELRFPDELVRHKILDITGDFYLLGHPVRGRIRARKTGHADNVALLRLIRETYPHLSPKAARPAGP